MRLKMLSFFSCVGWPAFGELLRAQRKNRQSHTSHRNGRIKIMASSPLSSSPLRRDWWIRALSHWGQLTTQFSSGRGGLRVTGLVWGTLIRVVCLFLNKGSFVLISEPRVLFSMG